MFVRARGALPGRSMTYMFGRSETIIQSSSVFGADQKVDSFLHQK
jgi:hypothetical protein